MMLSDRRWMKCTDLIVDFYQISALYNRLWKWFSEFRMFYIGLVVYMQV